MPLRKEDLLLVQIFLLLPVVASFMMSMFLGIIKFAIPRIICCGCREQLLASLFLGAILNLCIDAHGGTNNAKPAPNFSLSYIEVLCLLLSKESNRYGRPVRSLLYST